MSIRIPYLRYRKPSARQAESQRGRRMALRRRILEWLCSLPDPPTAIGYDVPVNGTHNRADIAAFWSRREKNGTLVPVRSIAIVCALDRRECWAAGVNPDSLLLELHNLKKQINDLETTIRQQEPSLRDSNVLFDEYAEWDYSRSRNGEYHQALRHRHALEGRLYHGTRGERLKESGILDEVYVAIPEGTLLAGEPMGSCGLLVVPINADEPVRLEVKPKALETTVPRRMQLVQWLAASALPYLRAANGLR